MNIATLILSTVLASQCHFPQSEIIEIPISSIPTTLQTHTWIGEILDFDETTETYTIHVEAQGDEIFLENFEPYDFSHLSIGWGIRYFDDTGDSFLGDLTCGRQVLARAIVINCNVVQP